MGLEPNLNDEMATVALIVRAFALHDILQMESAKKEDIIIELGSEFIRVGLVGDKVPRKTIRSGNVLRYHDNSDKYEIALEELLYNIFFSYINCSCAGKTVVLLQRVYTDRRVLESLTKIMFRKLKIERVELGLSCVTPLYLTGKYSGLVVSAGASTMQLMAVFEGYPLFRAFQCLPIGTQNLNKFIRDDLALLNKEISLDLLRQITEDEISDIRNTHAAIPASNNVIPLSIRKIRLKFIPEKINLALFFGNPDSEQHNIAYSFLKLLNEIPPECLEAVCSNVVLAGGFWRIRGMQKHFKKQILEQLVRFPKLNAFGIKSKLSFVSWSFNPSEVAWIGCSIGASIRSIEYLSLRKEEFKEGGFTEKIMKTYFLSC